MTPPTVLVVGGTDSSGGAGLAADICTTAAFDVAARLAVTAVTAQSDARVGTVRIMPPALVAEQIGLALADGSVDAVKIGMLGAAATVEAVADALAPFEGAVVLDPVLAASSGGLLLEEAGIARLLERLLPRTSLLTPNLPELDLLADRLGLPPGMSVEEKAAEILERGVGAVLVKGGHADGSFALDTLVRPEGPPFCFQSRRIAARLRGTGCMLATAIAAGLARQKALAIACQEAKSYLDDRFREAQQSGLAGSHGD